jgi:hypothetical protein
MQRLVEFSLLRHYLIIAGQSRVILFYVGADNEPTDIRIELNRIYGAANVMATHLAAQAMDWTAESMHAPICFLVASVIGETSKLKERFAYKNSIHAYSLRFVDTIDYTQN